MEEELRGNNVRCKNCNKLEVNKLGPSYMGSYVISQQHIDISEELMVYCSSCRCNSIPEYIPDEQYSRYWIEFSKKYRIENEM